MTFTAYAGTSGFQDTATLVEWHRHALVSRAATLLAGQLQRLLAELQGGLEFATAQPSAKGVPDVLFATVRGTAAAQEQLRHFHYFQSGLRSEAGHFSLRTTLQHGVLAVLGAEAPAWEAAWQRMPGEMIIHAPAGASLQLLSGMFDLVWRFQETRPLRMEWVQDLGLLSFLGGGEWHVDAGHHHALHVLGILAGGMHVKMEFVARQQRFSFYFPESALLGATEKTSHGDEYR